MDAPKIEKEKKMSDEIRINLLEEILRKNVKSKTLTDEAFHYMALLINEDAPKNYKELIDLIHDFLTDGHQYTEEEGIQFCISIYKTFQDAELIDADNKQTIIAEKLSQPVCITDLVQ
jgi:hypothetical protein